MKTGDCVFSHKKHRENKTTLNCYTLLKCFFFFLTLNAAVSAVLRWGLCLFMWSSMYLYLLSLIWSPFLSASHYLCWYHAACLPSAELPIDHLWVNIQELRTLCSINRSLSRTLIVADSRTHLSRRILATPPSPPRSWGYRGDFGDRKMASALTLLVLLQLALYSSVTCKKGEMQHCFIWV